MAYVRIFKNEPVRQLLFSQWVQWGFSRNTEYCLETNEEWEKSLQGNEQKEEKFRTQRRH